jgi:hypothetical protein
MLQQNKNIARTETFIFNEAFAVRRELDTCQLLEARDRQNYPPGTPNIVLLKICKVFSY